MMLSTLVGRIVRPYIEPLRTAVLELRQTAMALRSSISDQDAIIITDAEWVPDVSDAKNINASTDLGTITVYAPVYLGFIATGHVTLCLHNAGAGSLTVAFGDNITSSVAAIEIAPGNSSILRLFGATRIDGTVHMFATFDGSVQNAGVSVTQIEASIAESEQAINTTAAEVSVAHDEVIDAKTAIDETYVNFIARSTTVEDIHTDVIATYNEFVPKYDTIQSQMPVIELAEKWADQDRDIEVTAGKYSAKHWASVAEDSANSAVQSVEQLIEELPPTPKFYTKTISMSQNTSTIVATPNVPNNEGLNRSVSIFEEVVGSSLTDASTDFDLADVSQFTLRNYAPATAITLVGNEVSNPVANLTTDSGHANTIVSEQLDDNGSRVLAVAYDPAAAVHKAYVISRLGPGSYSVGAPVSLGAELFTAKLLRLNATTLVLTYRGTSSLPYVYYLRVITVSAAGVITMGSAQVLRNSGYSYGTPTASCCRISDTEFCALVVDVIPNGGNQYLNYAKVTVSGTTATVGAWYNVLTAPNGFGWNIDVYAVSSGVLALMWVDNSYLSIRLLDVTTTPYTLGGAAITTSIYTADRVFGVASLSSSLFAILYGGTSTYSYAMRWVIYSHVGTATPAYVNYGTFLSGVGSSYLGQNRTVVQLASNKYRVYALSDGGTYNKAYYVDFSLSASNTLSVDAVQSATLTGANHYGSYPSTHVLAADGYVWSLAPHMTNYTYGSFEYRPSLTGTLASGVWNATDVGRSTVVSGGVATITSINGATATMLTKSALSSSRYAAAGEWKLQDAALYDGFVYNTSGVPSVIITSKDISLWESIYSASMSASSGAAFALSFDSGINWGVWYGAARRLIASSSSASHGGADGTWMHRNADDTWSVSNTQTSMGALEQAFGISKNIVTQASYSSIGTAAFASLGFNKDIHGTVGVAFYLPGTVGAYINQYTMYYTGRSTWKLATNNYTVDCGREDQVTVTKSVATTTNTRIVVTSAEK